MSDIDIGQLKETIVRLMELGMEFADQGLKWQAAEVFGILMDMRRCGVPVPHDMTEFAKDLRAKKKEPTS